MRRASSVWRLIALLGWVLVGSVVFVFGGYDEAGNRPIAVAGFALFAIGVVGGLVTARRSPRA